MEGAGHVLDRGQLHDRGKLEAESQDDGATAPFLTPGDLFCLSDPAATAGSPCVVVKDGFLGSVKALEAFEGAVEVERTGAMKPAGMGRGNEVWHSEHDRGDRITWITGGIRGSGELPQVLEELLQRLYALREALNEAVPGGTGDGNAAEDRLGLVDTVVSAQLARYPGDGRGYVRHRDVAHNAELSEELDRKITVLYYLNPKWEPRMGGQLRIHLDADGIGVEGSKQSTSEPANGRMWDVEPLLDRLVLFRSDIVHHEVLPALAPRLAVTLWFYGRNLGGGRACARGPARPLVPPLRAEQLPATTPATAEPCDAGGDTRSKVRSLPVPEEDGREHAMEASIFVSVVSYRDPEANPTVVDLLARASNPRRVSVGLVWQLDLAVAEDHAMYTSTPRGDDEVLRGGHLRSVLIPAADAAGPSWARRVAQSLWAGEEYFLQIDSHTRFRPGWDSYLIHTLGRCPSPKPILTTYPVGYELPHRIPAGETRPTLLVPDGFGADDGVLRQTGRLMMRKAREPLPSPLWASGFSFSSSALLLEVPYDPGLRHVFFGEEVSMAARMYTRGWDFFAPPQTVVYHLWSRAHRPSFRQVSTRETEMQEKRARGRVRRLLGLDVSRKSKKIGIPVDGNAEDRSPDFLEWYGLGDTRTLQSFENRVGVNLRSSTVLPEARNAGRPSTDFNDSLASGLKDIMGILRRAGVDSGPHGSCSDDTPQVGALEHGRT